jgi:DNA-binding GntR family transcriptional regulator
MRKTADINQNFHTLILSAAGSARLVNILSGLSRVPLLFGVHPDAYEVAMVRSLAHHREIVDALRSRDDGWAEAAMTAHIRAARAAHRFDARSEE